MPSGYIGLDNVKYMLQIAEKYVFSDLPPRLSHPVKIASFFMLFVQSRVLNTALSPPLWLHILEVVRPDVKKLLGIGLLDCHKHLLLRFKKFFRT